MNKTNSRSDSGFTRVDLLAVTAVIAVFALIGTVKLAAAGTAAAGTTCTGNMQTMMRALHLYTSDNADFLPPNSDIPNQSAGLNWLIHDGRSLPDATNSAKLISAFNLLAPYLNGNARVFRCPSDTSTITVNGIPRPRVRSISLNHTIGTNFQSPGCKTATDGPWLDGSHNHTANRTFRTYARVADVVNPRPGDLFAFLDEHPDSINDASFGCIGPRPTGTGYTWIDWPATYHDKAGGFGFMDGHAEIKQWFNTGTLVSPPNPGASQQDLHWLATHATAPVVNQP
jgi:hypothetical protein